MAKGTWTFASIIRSKRRPLFSPGSFSRTLDELEINQRLKLVFIPKFDVSICIYIERVDIGETTRERKKERKKMNPFGTPIGDETLQQMPRYRDRKTTQQDRAREALRLIHSEDKNLAALQHALDLKSSFGVGASAMVLIYNATGDTLEMVDEMDWRGDIYHEHPPLSFENGQWISFLHVRGMTFYSEAARVYRGHNIRGQVRDYMVAWSVPWDPSPTSVSLFFLN
jgi:hypothetical protein